MAGEGGLPSLLRPTGKPTLPLPPYHHPGHSREARPKASRVLTLVPPTLRPELVTVLTNPYVTSPVMKR